MGPPACTTPGETTLFMKSTKEPGLVLKRIWNICKASGIFRNIGWKKESWELLGFELRKYHIQQTQGANPTSFPSPYSFIGDALPPSNVCSCWSLLQICESKQAISRLPASITSCVRVADEHGTGHPPTHLEASTPPDPLNRNTIPAEARFTFLSTELKFLCILYSWIYRLVFSSDILSLKIFGVCKNNSLREICIDIRPLPQVYHN